MSLFNDERSGGVEVVGKDGDFVRLINASVGVGTGVDMPGGEVAQAIMGVAEYGRYRRNG